MAAFRQHEAGRKVGAAARSVREPSNSSIFVASIPPVAAASPFAAAPAAASVPQEEASELVSSTSTDEYPSTVQELVMNGFALSKVIRAYELIGDNFDDLLLFLMNANA